MQKTISDAQRGILNVSPGCRLEGAVLLNKKLFRLTEEEKQQHGRDQGDDPGGATVAATGSMGGASPRCTDPHPHYQHEIGQESCDHLSTSE